MLGAPPQIPDASAAPILMSGFSGARKRQGVGSRGGGPRVGADLGSGVRYGAGSYGKRLPTKRA